MKALAAILSLAAALLATAAPGPGAAEVVDVERSMAIAAPAERVWAEVTDFCGLLHWHPTIEGCRLIDGGGASLRLLTFVNRAEVLELRQFQSEKTMTVTYLILQAPLPLSDYWSSLTVTPEGDGGSLVAWRGRFAVPEAHRTEAHDLTAVFYELGLEGLAKKLEP